MRLLLHYLQVLTICLITCATISAEVFVTQDEVLVNGACHNRINVKYTGQAGPCTISLYLVGGSTDQLVQEYLSVQSDETISFQNVPATGNYYIKLLDDHNCDSYYPLDVECTSCEKTTIPIKLINPACQVGEASFVSKFSPWVSAQVVWSSNNPVIGDPTSLDQENLIEGQYCGDFVVYTYGRFGGWEICELEACWDVDCHCDPEEVEIISDVADYTPDTGGSISLSVVNGTADYNFTFQDMTTTNSTGSFVQNDLQPGSYIVSIKDGSCIDTQYDFEILDKCEEWNLDFTTNFCDNSITVNVNSNNPTEDFEFLWSHDSGLNSNVARDLSTGSYSVTVTDILTGCEKELQMQMASVLDVIHMEGDVVSGSFLCSPSLPSSCPPATSENIGYLGHGVIQLEEPSIALGITVNITWTKIGTPDFSANGFQIDCLDSGRYEYTAEIFDENNNLICVTSRIIELPECDVYIRNNNGDCNKLSINYQKFRPLNITHDRGGCSGSVSSLVVEYANSISHHNSGEFYASVIPYTLYDESGTEVERNNLCAGTYELSYYDACDSGQRKKRTIIIYGCDNFPVDFDIVDSCPSVSNGEIEISKQNNQYPAKVINVKVTPFLPLTEESDSHFKYKDVSPGAYLFEITNEDNCTIEKGGEIRGGIRILGRLYV